MGSDKRWAGVTAILLVGVTLAFAAAQERLAARDSLPLARDDQTADDATAATAAPTTASSTPQATPSFALQPLGAMWFEPDDSRQLILAYETPWNGTGVSVGVRDGGVYAAHPDLIGQFLAGSDVLTNNLHGTMVCSILMGRGTRDLGCTHGAKGVAYGAKVLFQRTWDSYATAFAAWKNAGIQISNHSYSLGDRPYMYTDDTANFDRYADTDDAVIIVGCGDGGTHVTNPAIGKNVLAVGALTYATSDVETIGAVAGYSNPGPTSDDGASSPT